MALKDEVSYHAQTCIRAYVVGKQLRANLSNVSREKLIDLVVEQIRGEFEDLLLVVKDYLSNNPDFLTEKDHVR